jgi:ethanolamine ammonia-lyase large subunit
LRCAAADRFDLKLLVPYESDEVTAADHRQPRRPAFAPVAHLTVGGLRDWLLSDATTPGPGRTGPGPDARDGGGGQQADAQPGPDAGGAKVPGHDAFRNTIGLPGHLAVRLQPNHPTDDPARHGRLRCSTG